MHDECVICKSRTKIAYIRIPVDGVRVKICLEHAMVIIGIVEEADLKPFFKQLKEWQEYEDQKATRDESFGING